VFLSTAFDAVRALLDAMVIVDPSTARTRDPSIFEHAIHGDQDLRHGPADVVVERVGRDVRGRRHGGVGGARSTLTIPVDCGVALLQRLGCNASSPMRWVA
jgi:hypothetical protein